MHILASNFWPLLEHIPNDTEPENPCDRNPFWVQHKPDRARGLAGHQPRERLRRRRGGEVLLTLRPLRADGVRRQRRRRTPNTPGDVPRRDHRGGGPMKPSRLVTSAGLRRHAAGGMKKFTKAALLSGAAAA